MTERLSPLPDDFPVADPFEGNEPEPLLPPGLPALPRELAEFTDNCIWAVEHADPRATIRGLMEDLVAYREGLVACNEDLAYRLGRGVPVAAVDCTASGLVVGAEAAIYEDDDLTVTLIDTFPGVLQPPHEHRMTAIIGVVEGVEHQRLFARTADGIRPTGERALGPGEVITLGPQAIHAISSPEGMARAVHVYLGPINTVERSMFHPDTFAEMPMEMSTYHAHCREAPS